MGPYIRLRRFVGIGFALVLIQSTCTTALEAQTTSIPFLVNNGGSDSETTAGTADTISVGYGRMQPGTGRSTPSGVAIFGLRENDILVSEAGVPASAATTAGRIRAEVNGPLTTGLALANPGSSDAVVTFYFSDQTRNSFDSGTTTIPAGGQIAKFLNEAPFNGGSSIDGTFTFTSNLPIAAVALRGFTNERGEFLLTTLPVSPLTAATGEVVYFPHFADGGGWTTEVVLVNPTNSTISGTVEFFEQGTAGMTAQPVTLTINSQTASTFSYTIPGRSSASFPTAGTGGTTQSGSVRVTPSQNSQTPSGVAVFSFRSGNITVTQAGVPASSTGQAFRLHVEATDATAGTIQTGIAIANPSSSDITVMFALLTPGGGSTGMTGSVTVPGNGQIAQFLGQIQGLDSLTTPFEGVLRISTAAAGGIALVGLRSRVNEREDFLITTTTLVDESAADVTDELYFPHLVDGGGYTTQFIQLSGSTDQAMLGTLGFFSQTGAALDLPLAKPASSQVQWQNEGTGWSALSTPPNCESPLVLPTPVALSRATSVLYPGQLRGGTSYKAHGGFRFDGQGQGNDVAIFAPMDANIWRGARYLEGGILQHMFDFVNECGIMYRIDHLLDLSPRLQAIADTLPGAAEGQSQTTNLPPGIRFRAGESLATSIGSSGNVFFDWGVYDLRSMNAASNDAGWLAAHPGEQAPYGICWLEFLSTTDGAIVNVLPAADGVAGSTSDYCN